MYTGHGFPTKTQGSFFTPYPWGRESMNTGDREKRIKNNKSTTLFRTGGRIPYTGSQALTANEIWLKVTCTPENPMRSAVNVHKN